MSQAGDAKYFIYHWGGQHQVKGHHAQLEVDWTKTIPAKNLLTHLLRHPTLLTDTQIQSYICAWTQDRQNIAFLQKSTSLFPSSLDLRQRFKKQDFIKVGSSMCLKCCHISTQPMAWLSLHRGCGFCFLSFLSFLSSQLLFWSSGQIRQTKSQFKCSTQPCQT